MQQKQGQQREGKDIGDFQKTLPSILHIDAYPAVERSTISSASINSNLILIQCLPNEADQDHSCATSWLKHAESCNIHSHQKTEEWKQSPTKAVTETQYIRCYQEWSVLQEKEFHFVCAYMWQTHVLVN